MSKPMDENDRLNAGKIPPNPEADSDPVVGVKSEEGEKFRVPKIPTVGELLVEALDTMNRRAEGIDKPLHLPWRGMQDLKVWPGTYALVGGTGSGKTQWALQMGLQAALEGTPVLYVGLELNKVGLVARLMGLASESHVSWSKLYHGDKTALATALAESRSVLERIPFRFELVDAYGWPYNYLEGSVKAAADKHGKAPLVVLDYLQLVQSPKDVKREELRERIGKASYAAVAAAREHNSTVFLVSSTARENYRKLLDLATEAEENAVRLHERMPPPSEELLGVGKESGETEYSVDAQLVLVRVYQRIEASKERTKATKKYSVLKPVPHTDSPHRYWLAIAKNRAGLRQWVPFSFDGGRFEDRNPWQDWLNYLRSRKLEPGDVCYLKGSRPEDQEEDQANGQRKGMPTGGEE